MNRELQHVKKWLEANKLALNIEKTNHVIFHSPVKKITETVKIKFGRKHISRSDSIKFLGVLLDETLSWRSHLVELSRKLARSVGIFYKLRHFVPLETLKSVYYALFYPFLSYGITVWGATHGQYLSPVLVSQKRVVRAMTFSDPFALSLPLFYLMIYIIFNMLLLFMNVITNLLQTILVIILLRYLIFIITILGVLPMVTFFLREKTLYSMVYALCVLMELKFGITSLLISETLHQLQTSRKKIKELLLESYNSAVWLCLFSMVLSIMNWVSMCYGHFTFQTVVLLVDTHNYPN